jgi:hypothetical protein
LALDGRLALEEDIQAGLQARELALEEDVEAALEAAL